MRRNPKDLREGLKEGQERLEVEEEALRLAGGAKKRAREAGS